MPKVCLRHRVARHGKRSSFAISSSCKDYRLLQGMVPSHLSWRHCCWLYLEKVTPASARGTRKGATCSSPLTWSGGLRLELMMLQSILNPGLQLSAKNDTVCAQNLKHHCLCTVGKMPIQCFQILPLLQLVSIKGSATVGTRSLENGRSLNLCLVSKPHCLQRTEGFCLKCL